MGTLFVIGGDLTRSFYQLVKYDTSSNVMVDEGGNYLAHRVYSLAQGYVQHDNKLYVIQYEDDSISIFDLVDQSYTSSVTTIASGKESYTSGSSCLAHTGTHLVVIGGRYVIGIGNSGIVYMNNVFTFEINNNSWDNTIPSINTGRAYHSCTYIANTLYVIR